MLHHQLRNGLNRTWILMMIWVEKERKMYLPRQRPPRAFARKKRRASGAEAKGDHHGLFQDMRPRHSASWAASLSASTALPGAPVRIGHDVHSRRHRKDRARKVWALGQREDGRESGALPRRTATPTMKETEHQHG